MKILLSPMRCEGALEVSKAGDVLTINGESFAFTSLPEGATIPAGIVPCDWIAGPVERVDGVVNVTLILPHGPNPSEVVAFPSPIENPPDGVIDLPREPSNVDA